MISTIKRYSCICVLLFLTLCFFNITAQAQNEAVPKGINWLKSQQNSDGSWSQDKKQLVDTVESFKALVQSESAMLSKTLGYINALPETDNYKLGMKLLILSYSSADTAALSTKLNASRKTDGGWGLSDSKQSNIADTVTVLNALLQTASPDSQVIAAGRDFLTGQQQANGSWIFTDESSPSDLVRTAKILITLKAIERAGINSSALSAAVNKSIQFIETSLTSSSTTIEKAWSYLALATVKQPAELQETLSAILNAQNADGSWDNDIYTTAVVLQAANAVQPPTQGDLPDLKVETNSITFSPPIPLSGSDITLTATVFNTGTAVAENVSVEFFNRDPRLDGTAIGIPQSITSIPAGGSAQVSVTYDTTGIYGDQQIVLFVDYANTVTESSEINNSTAKILSITGTPDLAISVADITVSATAPQAFDPVTITTTVHNIGTAVAENIPVKFMDGTAVIASMTLAVIPPGQSAEAKLTTSFSVDGNPHIISVVIDPDHSITQEIKTDNNSANSVEIIAIAPTAGAADLQISSITANPAVPLSSDSVTFSITVVNTGGTAATGFDVELTDGSNILGVFTGNDAVTLDSGAKAVLTVPGITSLTAGSYSITATADTAGTVTESDETNNDLTVPLTLIDNSTPPDLQITAFSVTPDNINTGDAVQVVATITNSGSETARNADGKVIVNFYDNNILVGSNVIIDEIAGMQSATVQLQLPLTVSGTHTIKAVVDPDNQIAEDSDQNNSSSSTINVTDAPRSDLQIAANSITFSTSSPQFDAAMQIFVTVKNSGTMINAPCKLLITDGNPLNGSAESIVELDIPALALGTQTVITADYTPAAGTANVKEIYAFADSGQAISELSENNNISGRQLLVGGNPDLKITADDINFSTMPLNAFDPVTITVTIHNIGNGNAENVTVQFLNGSTLITEMTLAGVTAGQSNQAILNTNFPAGTHNITVKTLATGDTDNTNNEAVKSITVTAPPTSSADLQITQISATPTVPLANSEINLAVTVVNTGGTAAENFSVEIKIDDIPVNVFSANIIAAGQQAVLTLNMIGGLAVGTHTIFANADSANSVPESNYANNSREISLTAMASGSPADLQIISINAPATISTNETALIAVAVKNSGYATVDDIVVVIYDNGTPVITNLIIPQLTGGQTANLQLEYTFATAGTHNLKAVADPDNNITEADDTNNEKTVQINLTASPLADLEITADTITFSNSSPKPGETIQLTVSVANQGTVASTPCKLLITDGNPFNGTAVLIKEINLTTIAPSTSITVNTDFTLTSVGSHDIYLLADSGNTITETNRDNNLAFKIIQTAPLPDLYINPNSITVSHTDLSENTTVLLKGTISNLGQVASEPVTVNIIDSTLESNHLIGNIKIQAIPSGNDVSFEILWNPARGTNKVTIQIDSADMVVEQNENNNIIEKDFTFTLPNTELVLFRLDGSNEIQTDVFYGNDRQIIKVFHAYPNAAVFFDVYTPDGNRLASSLKLFKNGIFGWETTNTPPTAENEYCTAYIAIVDLTSGIILESHQKQFTIMPESTVKFAKITPSEKMVVINRLYTIHLTTFIVNGSNLDSNFELRWKFLSPSSEQITNGTETLSFLRTELQKNFVLPDITHTFTETGDYILSFDILHAGNVIYSKENIITALPKIRVEVSKTLTPQILNADPEGKVHLEIKLKGVME